MQEENQNTEESEESKKRVERAMYLNAGNMYLHTIKCPKATAKSMNEASVIMVYHERDVSKSVCLQNKGGGENGDESDGHTRHGDHACTALGSIAGSSRRRCRSR